MSPFYVASTSKRTAAFFIDAILFMLPSVLFFILGIFRMSLTEFFLPWPAYLASTAFVIAFQFFFLKKYSSSPGKMAFNLIVADAETQQPGLTTRQVLIRIFSSLLYIPFSIAPAVFALFREDRRHLIDLIAKTQVLQKQPRPQKPKKRWILGSILLIYFIVGNAMNYIQLNQRMEFSREGILFKTAQKQIQSTPERTPIN